MAGSLTDIFAAMQNGVVALGNFRRQLNGSFNNISSQLTAIKASITPSSGIVTSIAGNTGAFTLNGTSGLTNTVNDIKLSAGSSVQFGAVKVDGTTITAAAGVISAVATTITAITNSLSSDVLMNNNANYFDGPSIAQGSSGTWFVTGTATVTATVAQSNIDAKLWDGTTVIDSTRVLVLTSALTGSFPMSVSGFITSPAANLRISCRSENSTSGVIQFNASGNSKDSTISAIRIA